MHRLLFVVFAVLSLCAPAAAHRPAPVAPAPFVTEVPPLGPAVYELQDEAGDPLGAPGHFTVVVLPTPLRGVYSLQTIYFPEDGPPVYLGQESGYAIRTETGYVTSTQQSTGTLELQDDGRWKEELSSGNSSYWG